MTILYLCDEYPPGRHGGIGTAVRLLAETMVKKGHTVIVAGLYDWGYGGQDYFEQEGVIVYRMRFRLSSSLLRSRDSLAVRLVYRLMRQSGMIDWDIRTTLPRYGRLLDDIVRKHRVELVEMADFQEYTPYARRYYPFPRLLVPVVVKLHGNQTYWLKEEGRVVPEATFQIEKSILDTASAVCSVSRYAATHTAVYFDYRKRVEVLYNGIRLPAAPIAGVSGNRKEVVFTGSLVAKKGIYQLMKAWNIVHARVPLARLLVFGRGDVQKCKALLSDDAGHTVIFKGHVSRATIYAALASAMVAVFPSLAETFGMAPLEAMACGAAVIYTERTSGPEVITPDVTGLLCDPMDSPRMADQIVYLLQNPDECSRLGRNARQRVQEQFDIDLIAEQHFAYYQRVLNGAIL